MIKARAYIRSCPPVVGAAVGVVSRMHTAPASSPLNAPCVCHKGNRDAASLIVFIDDIVCAVMLVSDDRCTPCTQSCAGLPRICGMGRYALAEFQHAPLTKQLKVKEQDLVVITASIDGRRQPVRHSAGADATLHSWRG
jgi:hypothetical protein